MFKAGETETTVTIPGIPDGYRAVRFGRAKKEDTWINIGGKIETGETKGSYLIVELINKPIEAGEGYRLIDRTVDTPQPGDEYWNQFHFEWRVRSFLPTDPWSSNDVYRRRIRKTEKITFHQVVATSRFHTYQEMIWVDRVTDVHVATGNKIEIEVPVKP